MELLSLPPVEECPDEGVLQSGPEAPPMQIDEPAGAGIINAAAAEEEFIPIEREPGEKKGKSAAMMKADWQALRLEAVRSVEAMWSKQSEVEREVLRQMLEGHLKNLCRKRTMHIANMVGQANMMLGMIEARRTFVIVDKLPDEEWHVVAPSRKNKVMMAAHGDAEEDRRIIIWGVEEGTSAHMVQIIVNQACPEQAKDMIESIRWMKPADSNSRVEITLKGSATQELRRNFMQVLDRTAAERRWTLKAGRRFVQRQSDRLWRHVQAPLVSRNTNPLKIWCWNAEGLSADKVAQLTDAANAVDIIAVQETWFYGRFSPHAVGYTWIGLNSQTRAKGSRARGGIGFFIRDGIASLVKKVDSWKDKILTIEYESRDAKCSVINAYAPTVGYERAERVEFFDRVKASVVACGGRGPTILAGDMNARIGRVDDVVGRFNETATNDNGPLFVKVLRETNMAALNGRNPCDRPEFTRQGVGLNATQSVIDYVCVNRRDINNASIRVLCTSFGSDHNLVEAKLEFVMLEKTPQTSGTLKKEKRPNFHPLIHNHPGCRNRFEVLCDSKFEGWIEEADAIVAEEESSPADKANRLHRGIVKHLQEAVNEGVPQSEIMIGNGNRRRKQQPWLSKKAKDMLKVREELRRKLIEKGRIADEYDELYLRFKNNRAALKKVIAADKQKYEGERQTRAVEDYIENPKKFWNTVKANIRSKDVTELKVKALRNPETNELVNTDNGILEVFQKAASSLYNDKGDEAKYDAEFYAGLGKDLTETINDEARDEAMWYNKKITLEEVKAAAEELKYHKAQDRDGVRAEWLKFASDMALEAVTDLFNYILTHGVVPPDWDIGTIIMLPKPGDPTATNNYRGITILSLIRKLLDRVLLTRMTANVQICEEQGGFRAERSCADQAMTLLGTIQNHVATGGSAYVCYVDFKKAYDRVWRDLLAVKMHDQAQIRGKTLRASLAMMKNAKGEIRYGGKLSEYFAIGIGVAQGAISSPMLFSIFINDLADRLAETNVGLQLTKDEFVRVLLFADDTALMAKNPGDLQQLLNKLEEFCRRWRLEVNETKTQVCVFGPERKSAAADEISYAGKKLETVNEYKYLGVWIRNDFTWKTHIAKMVQKANARVADCESLFRGKKLAIPFKLAAYKALVRPILEYGAEIWTPTGEELESIEKIQRRCAKMIVGVPDTTPTAALLVECGLEPMSTRIERAKLRFATKLFDPENKTRLIGKLWRSMLNMTNAEIKKRKWFSCMSNLLTEYAEVGQTAKKWSESTDAKEVRLKRKAILELSKALTKTKAAKLMEEAIQKSTKMEQMRSIRKPSEHMIKLGDYFQTLSTENGWKQQRLMFMLRAGNAPIGVEIERHEGELRKQRGAQTCKLCGAEGAEDQRHFLLKCSNARIVESREAALFSIAKKWAEMTHAPDVEAVTADKLEKLKAMPEENKLRLMLADLSTGMTADPEAGPIAEDPTTVRVLSRCITIGVWEMFKSRTMAMKLTEEALERDRQAMEERRKAEEAQRAERERQRRAQGKRSRAFGDSPGARRQTLLTLLPSPRVPLPSPPRSPPNPDSTLIGPKPTERSQLLADSFLNSMRGVLHEKPDDDGDEAGEGAQELFTGRERDSESMGPRAYGDES